MEPRVYKTRLSGVGNTRVLHITFYLYCILYDNLIGWTRYLRFVELVSSELLEDGPLSFRQKTLLQHNSVLRISADVRDHLTISATFSGYQFGGEDLIDCLLLRYIKSLAYETPVETNSELVARFAATSKVI